MYVVRASQVRAEMRTQAELDGILRIIAKQYAAVFRSGAMAMLNALDTPTAITAPQCADIILKMFANTSSQAFGIYRPIVGDIFFHENRVLALQPDNHMLTAWEISQHSATPHLPDFCEAVARAARLSIDGRRLRSMDFDWTKLGPPRPQSSNTLRSSGSLTRPMSELVTKAAALSEEIVSDANLLVNRERRDFLVRLAQLGKVRSADAKADVETDHVALLIDKGLVRKEFLVLCRKDSHTLCSVDSKAQLATEVRCAICNRLFSDELIQEIYAPTDRARAMLEGSHWMTVWVTSILVDSGIPLEQILWGATSGEDEIDIIANMGNQSIFFELRTERSVLAMLIHLQHGFNVMGLLLG